MATVDSAVVPIEDVASDPVAPAEGAAAAKSKSKKGKVSKEKKPRAPPSHPHYAEELDYSLTETHPIRLLHFVASRPLQTQPDGMMPRYLIFTISHRHFTEYI